jgi:MFS family permease
MLDSLLARTATRPRFYYGWVIVAVLSLTETVSWGILYYAFAVFIPSMEQALHWTRAQTTGAFSLALGISGLAAVPVGRWLDRHGSRGLMTFGSCLGVVLMFAWSQVQSLAALYVIWAGMGVAMALTLYDPAFAVLAKWFMRRRYRALTLLTLAAGLASTIFNPLDTWLIDQLGWRDALVTLAIILAILTIPPHALFLRRKPADLGLQLDGAGDDPAQAQSLATSTHTESVTAHAALRTPTFWALTMALVFSTFAAVSITVHIIPFLLERGYAMSFAALAVGLIGLMQLPGRMLFAPLHRWLSRRAVSVCISLLQCVGLVLLWWASDLTNVIVFVALFGMGNGMATLARASLVAEYFGPAHYGSIGGWIGLFTTGARSLAPIGAGLIFTFAGRYEPVLWTLIAVTVGAGVSFYLADWFWSPQQA